MMAHPLLPKLRQLKLGGKDNANVAEADAVNFNYSVDGSRDGALKQDVEISRMTAGDLRTSTTSPSRRRRETWPSTRTAEPAFTRHAVTRTIASPRSTTGRRDRLCGATGETTIASRSGSSTGPPAERL